MPQDVQHLQVSLGNLQKLTAFLEERNLLNLTKVDKKELYKQFAHHPASPEFVHRFSRGLTDLDLDIFASRQRMGLGSLTQNAGQSGGSRTPIAESIPNPAVGS